jgi:hypothetical protein
MPATLSWRAIFNSLCWHVLLFRFPLLAGIAALFTVIRMRVFT